jgi:hypothetical protein
MNASAAKPGKDYQSFLERLKKRVTLLTLNQDKTYTLEVSAQKGLPAMKDELGTWTQSGNKVVLTPSKEHGNPITNPKAVRVVNLSVSNDGKTMTQMLSNGKGRCVYTR